MGIIDKVVNSEGDLSALSSDEKSQYYREVCESIGLNPLTEPFKYIYLNSKLTLYATKAATEQLRKVNGVSLMVVSESTVGDIRVVRVRATDKNGRTDEATGAVSIASLKGDALANAFMKAETKAKRRATLSISGLGYLDETEIDTIPGAYTPPPEVTINISKDSIPETEPEKETGEIPCDSFEVLLTENPTKSGDMLQAQVVIYQPGHENTTTLKAPAKYESLLVEGAALNVKGILNNNILTAAEITLITDKSAENEENIVTLTSAPKKGTLTYKGQNIVKAFASCKYSGHNQVFVVGDAIEPFVSGDVLEVVIVDRIEKEGKLMLFVNMAEKAQQQVS